MRGAFSLVAACLALTCTPASARANRRAMSDVLQEIPWLQKELENIEVVTDARLNTGLPCKEPVKKAPVQFPDHMLVGDAAKDLVMYSGYVNVTPTDHLFYWFAEAERGAAEDTPLIVWSNGGPGCSSMEGFTTEHGPLIFYGVKEDSTVASGKFSRNPYSWNKHAHIVYVDQPRYVGFSCGTGPFVTTSVNAGLDMVNFIRGWRHLFPEHAHRDVILAAESYGGHFVPAWSSAVLDYNAAGVADPIQLVGLIIGNGIVNQTIQGKTFPEFARRHGLIPNNMTVESSWGAREIMRDYLGYEPNYYDYRLTEQGCCGCSSYNYKPWGDLMMQKDLTDALNVCGDSGGKAFGGCAAGCIELPSFDRNDLFSYSGALARALDQGIQLTLYYGMQDTACNYVGGYEMASALEWKGALGFAAKPLETLDIGGFPTGKMKVHEGLTWIQIEGAGHMVPINNPAAASFAVGTVIQGRRRGQGRKHASGGPQHAAPGVSPLSKWLRLPGSQVQRGESEQYRPRASTMAAIAASAVVLVAGWAAGRIRGHPPCATNYGPMQAAQGMHDVEFWVSGRLSEARRPLGPLLH